MKIDADSITAKTLQEMGGKTYNAAMSIARLSNDIFMGEITPAEAAAKLREILAPLQIEPDEPKWRYFALKDRTCFWRFCDDKSGSRNQDQTEWFTSLYTLQECIDFPDIDEITAEEGEP